MKKALIFLSLASTPAFAEIAVCTSELRSDRQIAIEFDRATRQVSKAVFSDTGHDSVADTLLAPNSYLVDNRGHGEMSLLVEPNGSHELFRCEGTRPY